MPRPLRSLRNRLTLIFALIVTAAIGIVYFYVTPRLEDELVSQKLERLAVDAQRQSGIRWGSSSATTRDRTSSRRITNSAARFSSAEVTVLQVNPGNASQLLRVADSDPGARGAGRRPGRGRAGGADGQGRHRDRSRRTSDARRSPPSRWSATGACAASRCSPRRSPTSQANVELIRQRILVAGAIALVLAALGGFLVARALTERIKRLERAARKVASGDFSNPIHADSDDELGQLAATFDDMQRQLARLDTARKQFIASASHELRTPIFSLGGFLELLEDEELDDETRAQFLAQLRGQVARLRKLATELLDLSRLESGSLELRPEPTDVGQLARDVAGEFTPAASAHDAELEVRAATEPIEIECDPERVAQVMRILLDNALVHTPAGTTIVVSAAREDGHVTLEVADSGLGIRHQTMPHIFEPFFTSADGARGAGLGLAIARELAERMHGQLTVRSVPGETAFKLTLPA